VSNSVLTSLTDLIVLVAISWSGPTTAAGGPGDHQRIPERADVVTSTMSSVVVFFLEPPAAEAVPVVAPTENTLQATATVTSKPIFERLRE